MRPVLVRYTQGSVQPMRIALYDADRLGRPERLSLASQDYIGEQLVLGLVGLSVFDCFPSNRQVSLQGHGTQPGSQASLQPLTPTSPVPPALPLPCCPRRGGVCSG